MPAVSPSIHAETGRSPLDVHVSNEAHDSEWDDFLRRLPNGSHVQTSFWGRLKAWQGWQITRIVVRKQGRIVGGAQALVRHSKLLGRVGYVPKGPVVGDGDADLRELLAGQLRDFAVDAQLRILFVQPANDGAAIATRMDELGFRPCPIETAPIATVMVDLNRSLTQIRAGMKKGLRNQVSRSERRGMSYRDGNACDLSTFHDLLTVTASRRGFTPFPLDYFVEMWNVLHPLGHVKLLVGEFESEPVCSQLVIPFGDTLVAKQIGWSGRHRHRHPNEGLDWATIVWAHARGLRHYDLEGIEPEAARALLEKQMLPSKFEATPTAYKLRFGGTVHLYPETFGYFPNGLLRSLYCRVGYRLANSPRFQRYVSRFRTS